MSVSFSRLALEVGKTVVYSDTTPDKIDWYSKESNFGDPDGSTFSFLKCPPLQARGRLSFQLLELLPGEPDDDIRCNLTLSNPENAPAFQALSYTWGSEEDLKGIFVNDKVMRVTSNLRSGLRHLRRKDHSRNLWVDAICIDQENPDEKSEQIQRMGKFYRASTKTIIWIGPASSCSHDALRNCQIMARVEGAQRQNREMLDIEWVGHERRVAESCLSPSLDIEKELSRIRTHPDHGSVGIQSGLEAYASALPSKLWGALENSNIKVCVVAQAPKRDSTSKATT